MHIFLLWTHFDQKSCIPTCSTQVSAPALSSSPDFLRGNNEVLYHYFETLRVSKCHFLEGLEIMRPWQESCVEATFLPQNFLKMLEIMRLFFFWFSRSVFQKKNRSCVRFPRRETLGTSENINRVERHRKNLEIGKEWSLLILSFHTSKNPVTNGS